MARKDPAKAEAAPLGVSGRLMQMVTALFADVPPETRLYALVAVVIQLSFLAVILLLPRETRLTCFAVNAVLILAYALLLRHRLGSSAHRPQAGTDQAPPSSLPPLVGGGIVAYYASRNQALPALTEQILRAERELTLCGIALSSVSPILKDDRIVAFVSRKLLETKSFKVTIVILCQESGEAFDLRHREIPSRDLGKVARGALEVIRKFRHRVGELVGESAPMSRFEVRRYQGMVPRHFLLKTDRGLSVGSYFSHREGGASYIMELSDLGPGSLYRLFDQELQFIMTHSEALSEG